MKRKHAHIAHSEAASDSTPASEDAAAAGGDCSPEAKPNYWYPALLLVVLLAPFVSFLLHPAGRVMGHPECDNPSAYYFINEYAARCWREGLVPLWNPYIMLGMPFLGEGQASVFHPLSFLFVFLSTGAAINWLITLAFVLTGFFFYGYLRALKLGQPAAWCGAVAWSFSNAMISRIYAGHLNILLTFISIPLVMMLWEKYRNSGKVQYLVGISCGYGLMILAYYPQFLYIFSLFFLFYVLVQSALAIKNRADARREGWEILKLGLFILLGIGVGAIQLLPSLEFVARSFRQRTSLAFCGIFSFPPENFLTLIAPGFFGTRFKDTPGLYWGRNYYWEMYIYLGMLPLIMAAVGAWIAPRRRAAALLFCAVLFAILGLGRHTPLFPLFYKCLPLFDKFRGPSKNMLIPLFCLVTLSAYGFDSLLAERDELKRRMARRIALGAAATLFAISFLVILTLFHNPDAPGSNWRGLMDTIYRSNEGRLVQTSEMPPAVIRNVALDAVQTVHRTILLIICCAGLIALSRLGPPIRRYLFPPVALLILADLLSVFIPLQRTFNEPGGEFPKEFQAAVESFPYPPRILNPPASKRPNIAMHYEYSSAFGYVGNTLKRYNDFISSVQGLETDKSMASAEFRRLTPQFEKLAYDAVVVDAKNLPPSIKPLARTKDVALVPFNLVGHSLPRAFLAEAPRNFTQREEALKYVLKTDVNVQARPAIERPEPPLAPHPLEPGESVNFVAYKPNRVEMVVHSRYPRTLVLCGMYDRNWTARVNGKKAQVVPANYVYRAVRVPAGTSRVIFKYSPAPFYWGLAITALSFVALALIGLLPYAQSGPPVAQSSSKTNSVEEESRSRFRWRGPRQGLHPGFQS